MHPSPPPFLQGEAAGFLDLVEPESTIEHASSQLSAASQRQPPPGSVDTGGRGDSRDTGGRGADAGECGGASGGRGDSSDVGGGGGDTGGEDGCGNAGGRGGDTGGGDTVSINPSIKDPHRASHGQGEADPSTATGGSNPCVDPLFGTPPRAVRPSRAAAPSDTPEQTFHTPRTLPDTP